MRVSWIEADDLKDLLARIAPSEPAGPVPAPRSWDIMPAVDPATAASFIITAEEPFVSPETQDTSSPLLDPIVPLPVATQVTAPPAPLAVETTPSAEEAIPSAVEATPPAVATAPLPTTPVQEDHSDHSASALPLSRIRDKLRAIRQRANEAGILAKGGESTPPPPPAAAGVKTPAVIAPPAIAAPPAAELPAPSLPSFDVPAGSQQERLAAFAGWARQILHEDGGHLLVMNDDGELLWGGEAKAGLVLSAMMAWGATLRGSAKAACASLPVLHQALASGNMLTAIPCETMTGVLLHAAVVAPARVPDEIALQLRQGLIRAAGTQFA